MKYEMFKGKCHMLSKTDNLPEAIQVVLVLYLPSGTLHKTLGEEEKRIILSNWKG